MSNKDKIIALPNPHLRQKSVRIKPLSADTKRIIEQMKSATLDWEAGRPHEVGVALAAIQIDKPYKIIIIRNNFEDKADRSFSVFLNPQIIKAEGELEEDFEGCLSVADIYGKVPRHSKVRLKALDENGQPIRLRADGFLARVLQHEVDHLNGTLFVDHIKDKPEAFFKLGPDGKLQELDYEQVKQSHIFR